SEEPRDRSARRPGRPRRSDARPALRHPRRDRGQAQRAEADRDRGLEGQAWDRREAGAVPGRARSGRGGGRGYRRSGAPTAVDRPSAVHGMRGGQHPGNR
ncbi:hypothetical protein COM78_32165, partial [Bacillus thuringiensis]